MSPELFSHRLLEYLRLVPNVGAFAKIPKNRRPFYQLVVEDFENKGFTHSPSGLTASIVAVYLRMRGEKFTILYDPKNGGYIIRRTK